MFKELVLADAFRINGKRSWSNVAKQALLWDTFRFAFVFRLAACAQTPPTRLAAKLWLRRQRLRSGISIPAATQIGPGLFMSHPGGIVINDAVTIGSNCNLGHQVTIGVSRGRNAGTPKIGNRVYIGPGAVIIGNITIGDDAAIGANAVVTRDVPSGHTAVGNPAIIQKGGSFDYINRVWPD